MQDLNRRTLLKLGSAAVAVATLPAVGLIAGCDSSWIQTAVDDIPVISNIVGSILSIVALGNPALSPEVAAAVNLALTTASAALVTLQTLINDYKTSKDASVLVKIDAALQDVQKNLSDVLAVAHIKDAGLQATIATGISLAISVVSAIQLLIPASAAPSANVGVAGVNRAQAQQAVPQKITITDANTVKMMYNVVAASCGYGAEVVK